MSEPNDPFSPPEPIPSADELDHSPTQDDRNLAILAHLSGCIGMLGAGMLGFVGPLAIYLWKKDTAPYVEAQAKEALNFQLTLLIVGVVCALVALLTCIGFPLILVAPILQVVYGIIAALAVRDGENYRYPYSIRFLQ